MFIAPGLATPANYTVTVTKLGYVTKITNLAFAGTGNQTLNLQLTPLPAAPTTVAVNRAVAPTAVRPGPNSSDPAYPVLELWDGGQLVYDLSGIKKDRMTVVISHGWVPNLLYLYPNSYTTALQWTIDLAGFIQKYHPGLADSPNILVWDWRKKAYTTLPQTDEAAVEGIELGKALHTALGDDYRQHVHFVAHSLGVIVNRYACDYAHGSLSGYLARDNPAAPWSASATKPQFTMLDEAELANVAGENVLTNAAIAGSISGLEGALLAGVVTAKYDWKYPVPVETRWVDNYISMVGFEHDEAVNVCLPEIALTTGNPIRAHSYAHDWYNSTVNAPGVTAPVSYGSSIEAGHAFPPSGTGFGPGNLWNENLDTSNPYDLIFDPHPIPHEASLAILASLTVVPASATLNAVDAAGQSVLSGYTAGIQFAGNVGGTVIYKTGEVATQSLEKVGLWWDAAQDAVTNIANSLNPDVLLSSLLATPVFGIQLQTSLAAHPNSGRNPNLAAAGTIGQPAAAWVTVKVPADAGLMAFDFTVTGDPQDDSVACAINDQNLFTLPGKFAPDGQTVSTDMMDVSAYAGQSVELFFGLVGGTSTSCQVAVDGIRFITVPPPRLVMSSAAGKTVLQWPAAATGWLLETSDTLSTENWQTVPIDSGVTISDGIMMLEQPMADKQRFYRLRKSP